MGRKAKITITREDGSIAKASDPDYNKLKYRYLQSLKGKEVRPYNKRNITSENGEPLSKKEYKIAWQRQYSKRIKEGHIVKPRKVSEY